MADVSRGTPTDTRSDRAQLLLATALVLASLFVFLTLILNSIIYTENLSTRPDAGSDVREAMAVRSTTTDELNRILVDVNRNGTNYSGLQSAFTAEVASWNDLSVTHRVANAKDVELSVLSMSNGTHILQANGSRNFTNVANAPTWELVDGSLGVRSFTATVQVDSLVDPSNSSTAADLDQAGVFNVSFTDSTGDRWRVYLYREAPAAVLRVAEPGGSLRAECSAIPGANGSVTAGVTAGQFNGTECSQLGFLDDLATPFSITYGRGDNVIGSYSLVVNRSESAVDDGDYAADWESSGPYSLPALYGAAVDFRYVSPEVDFATTLVVPSEGSDV